jgi:hypothetical protein
VEIAIAKLRRYKSPDIDQILTKLIQARGEMLNSEIHNLCNSVWNKEEWSEQWKESFIVPIYKKGDMTIVIIKAYHCYQLRIKFYPVSFSQG